MSQTQNAMVYASRSNWASRFPTLYILDICAVNATKLSRSQVARDSNKAELVSDLRFMDRPHHHISYMCALMEKVANADSDEDLERNVLRDMAALRNFFRCARVVESDDFVLGYMRELRNVAPELGQPNYLTYLEQVNGKHELRNAVSVAKRYQKAQELVRDADALGVPRQHPLVLITLACLYRNKFAIDLMKFKAQQKEFKAANALADIMAIVRTAKLKFMITADGRNTAKILNTEFVTDDAGLRGVFEMFEPTSVKDEELIDGVRTHYRFEMNKDFLTELSSNPSERQQILSLLLA